MKEIRINLTEEQYLKLKDECVQKDMTMSEYFRDLLSKQSGIELKIDFADIDNYVEQISELQKKIDSILPTIFRSGKIYEQEAVLIKQTLNQIHEKALDTWRYVTAMRTSLYDETRKKLYHSVKQNRYNKRHTTETMNNLEENFDS